MASRSFFRCFSLYIPIRYNCNWRGLYLVKILGRINHLNIPKVVLSIVDEIELEKCKAEYDSFWVYDLHVAHACLQCRTSKVADRM